MKKFLKAISGKKALFVVMALVIVGIVLEIITAIRVENYRIDYSGICSVCVCITCWAACLESREKKTSTEEEK